MNKRRNNPRPSREQMNSLDPKNNADTNSQFYGDDENISTQIVTNYNFNPRDFR